MLAAAGNDIYYRTFPRPDVEKRVKLSSEKGKGAAEQIARLLSAFKGAGGGRFYVNEFCSVFSPINGTTSAKLTLIPGSLTRWQRRAFHLPRVARVAACIASVQ
jgi:hypothetical protein